MPSTKQLHRYPEEYYQLFEKAQTEDVVLEFTSARQAKNFRVELYNLRRVCRDEALNSEEVAEHSIIMENIIISLDGTKLVLHKRSIPTHIKRILPT